MLKKELRDEIKQDELRERPREGVGWVNAHRDEVRIGAGVAIVLLAAAGAVGYFQGQRAREADRAFREALTTFEAPVASELAAGSRPTRRGRCSRPRRRSTRPRRPRSRASSGASAPRRSVSRAKYYAALSRLELGQYAEAEKALKEIQAQGGGLEPELARLALADLYRRSGQVDKAVEAYRGHRHEPVRERAARLRAAERRADARGREALGGGARGVPAGVRGVPGERLRPGSPGARRVPPEPAERHEETDGVAARGRRRGRWRSARRRSGRWRSSFAAGARPRAGPAAAGTSRSTCPATCRRSPPPA